MCLEAPPHAWRRFKSSHGDRLVIGNTSTCVEKISPPERCPSSCEKHLHVRGEDPVGSGKSPTMGETPPRAWRRFEHIIKINIKNKKHLHVRGEDLCLLKRLFTLRETPPRAWRRSESNLNLATARETPPRAWRR